MYKKYSVVRIPSEEVLEEFSSMEAAEKFMILMRKKGENVKVLTNKDDEEDDEGFEIEGLELEEPEVEFGNDLDMFDEEEPGFSFDNNTSGSVESSLNESYSSDDSDSYGSDDTDD